jgi:hypothetical protein
MKFSKVIVTLAALFSANAMAAEANLFVCANKAKKIEIAYTTSSFDGKPTFSVTRGEENLYPGNLEQNRVAMEAKQTFMGKVVSGAVNRKHIADAPDRIYSVVIPHIIMNEETEAVKFKTVGMFGFSGGFRRPPFAVQVITETVTLNCTAQAVNF